MTTVDLQTTSIVRTKPLMSMPSILIMNLGFFGIQYSFGMQQTAVNPVYEFLGADPGDLPILNLAGPITGLLLQPGMVFTIEPMINLGRKETKLLPDGWTVVTADGKPSAQFEHTVGVTVTGCEIFTLSPAGLHCPPYRLPDAA